MKQISKLTEKMNKISKDLSSERMASEKLQKDNSGQLSQHVTENRKLALEISKLKVSHTKGYVMLPVDLSASHCSGTAVFQQQFSGSYQKGDEEARAAAEDSTAAA